MREPARQTAIRKGSIKMTDEKSADLTPAEGAPAPQKSAATKKNVAASKQSTRPLFTLATPVPTPAPPSLAEEVLAESDETDDGLTLSEADFEGAVGHDENRILRHSSARLPSAWVQGPGQVELLVEGVKLAQWAATVAGTPMSQIEAVIAKALPKVNMVVVAPAKAGAAGSIETRQEDGAIHFTISDLLRAAGMAIASGSRALYPVKKVTKSPIGPAIAINLGAKPLAARKLERKKNS